MMRPLLQGQTLCPIPDNVIYDPDSLSTYIQEMQITRMLFTPSLLESMLESKCLSADTIKSRMHTLKTIVLCGEVVKVALQERIRSLIPWARIWNLYSVSECHDVAALDLTDGNYGSRKYCPVGKLMEGVEAIILEEGTTVATLNTATEKATGEQGELYVAGPTLARGYVGKEQLTAERFPSLANGKRLYKTGDRARVLPNRELEILGRNDSMVKIRGYSVELRAIEAAIMDMSHLVSTCVCTVQGEEGDDKFVVAYIVLNANRPEATCRRVRLELKTKLPHFMIPAYMLDMVELPTNEVSGKLNKKALPVVDVQSGAFVYPATAGGKSRRVSANEMVGVTTPRTDLELRLLGVWCEVMKMHQIDVVFDSFFDIGGHSLIAPTLCRSINDKCKADYAFPRGTEWTDMQVVDLFTHSSISKLAEHLQTYNNIPVVVLDPTAAADPTSDLMPQLSLEREVDMHDASRDINDISMRAFWRSTHFTQVRARAVLMTGATGYLGAHLLHELLLNPDIDVVYCIVRAPATQTNTTSDKETAAAVQERVRTGMQAKGLWKDEYEARVHAFAGDSSLFHLGLEDDDFAVLSTGVDMVIHCAALVNLVYPYDGMRSANVIGTRNMIDFALQGKVKRFGYVSTDGVFPEGLKEVKETDPIDKCADELVAHGNGYSQSKWVAEQLVQRASDRGLPTVIFRPGNMGGDSGSRGGNKSWNTSDTNFLTLTGCIQLGAAPDADADTGTGSEWVLEMTPVDIAARAIVKLSMDNTCLGKVYHVTNFANSLTAKECFNIVRNSASYGLESKPLDQWKAQLTASANPTLARLKNAMILTDDITQLERLSTFNNDLFVEKCAAAGIVLPEITQTLLHEYIEAWQQAGYIKLPSSPGKPLLGRRICVMGASSGIGAAIANVLSDAGATVGLGGRRIDRLKDLAKSITARTGSKVVCYQVDVTKKDEVKAYVTYCEEAMGGGVDVYVNNSGVMHYTKLSNMREDQWEKEVDVNCKGLLHAIGAVLPGMLERGRGHLIATSSDAGRKVFPGLSVYSASKHFVEALCQGLRLETAGTGIKVTTIQPGDCKTELSTLTTDEEARDEYAQPSDDRDVWLDPEDVANSVLFAVSAPQHVGINEILVEPRGAPA
ncbi:hypothetical protein SARC_11296 [Sphaeroforma arctica JP610]|uniref:Carrier domain-containing protein n=1 Tax=Sphaeroforma arctica JP610 TaxID=667725 RepID=A0A0L0FHE2_9EUKA|nr:hypothetical protein SARC_11296 [Sphaeroforma arctica JP610]KNC76192.1 hypothetical protein SARC_11296 [Sphaeroforma arctica JP610]|eukprot:XP_014150094.1 hypothetical protein SARC_11296 [Sphaeroforma arctica JP610]